MAKNSFSATRDPHATRIIEQIRETGLRIAAETLPRLAETSRQAGRSAQAAGETIANRLAAHSPSPLRQATRSGLLYSAGRFAMRRPVMLAMGGIALAGVAIAIGRKMRAEREGKSATMPTGTGEGSYEGTRDYAERTRQFIKDKGQDIKRRASEAKVALEGPEGPTLENAEAAGRMRARS